MQLKKKLQNSKPAHLQKKCKGEILVQKPKEHQQNTTKEAPMTNNKNNKEESTNTKGQRGTQKEVSTKTNRTGADEHQQSRAKKC